jgi:hypothetical protein
LLLELTVETEKQGSGDVVKKCGVFIKLPAQKIHIIHNWQLGEERGNIKANEDVVRKDPDSAQCEDKALRILHMICRFPRYGPSRPATYLESL